MQTSTHKPTVSVIMATRNRASMLAQAIESIRNQTLTDWQLIITDDASHDETPAILRAYSQKDPRIQYHRLDEHQGVATARNVAIQHAQGAYIALQDDDDISLPSRLAEQVGFLQKHQHIGLVGCLCALFNEKGITPSDYGRGLSSHVTTLRPIEERQSATEVFPGTLVGKADVFRKIPYRPFFQQTEDCDALIRYIEHYNLETIPKILYHYRHGLYDKQTNQKNYHFISENHFILWMSAFHRFMGWQDPIDTAQSRDDIFHHIHPDFRQKAAKKIKIMIKNITHRIDYAIAGITTQQITHLDRFVYNVAGKDETKHFRIKMMMRYLEKYPHEQEKVLKVKRAFYRYNAMFIFDMLRGCRQRRRWDLIKPVLNLAIRSRA